MSERLLSAGIIALIQAGTVEPAAFLYADFPSGAKRVWTGIGNYTDGEANVWEGIGGVVEIRSIQETIDIAASGLSVTLDGLDDTVVQKILGDNYQGRAAEFKLGFWDRNTNEVIFTDEPVWKGTLDMDESEIAAKGVKLTIICEHRMADVLRKREARYTNEDQQRLHPTAGDTAFTRIEQIQDVTIPWGRTQL